MPPAAPRDRTAAAATAVLECGSPLPLSFKPDGAGEARAGIKPVEEGKSPPAAGRKGVGLIARRLAGRGASDRRRAGDGALVRPPGPGGQGLPASPRPDPAACAEAHSSRAAPTCRGEPRARHAPRRFPRPQPLAKASDAARRPAGPDLRRGDGGFGVRQSSAAFGARHSSAAFFFSRTSSGAVGGVGAAAGLAGPQVKARGECRPPKLTRRISKGLAVSQGLRSSGGRSSGGLCWIMVVAVLPYGGRPGTREPYAREPHVRFGGRGAQGTELPTAMWYGRPARAGRNCLPARVLTHPLAHGRICRQPRLLRPPSRRLAGPRRFRRPQPLGKASNAARRWLGRELRRSVGGASLPRAVACLGWMRSPWKAIYGSWSRGALRVAGPAPAGT